MVQDSTTYPSGDFQVSHGPANTMGDPSLSRMYHQKDFSNKKKGYRINCKPVG
jgi:hypothetical protein